MDKRTFFLGVLFLLFGGFILVDTWMTSSYENVSGKVAYKNVREVVASGRSGESTTYYLDVYITGFEDPYWYVSGSENKIKFYSRNIRVGDNAELHIKSGTNKIWGHSRNGAITIDPSIEIEMDYLVSILFVIVGILLSLYGLYSIQICRFLGIGKNS